MGNGLPESSWITTLVGWAGAVASAIAVGAWKGRGLQADLDKRIDAEAESLRSQMGEMGLALRQKIVDTEMWNRDNFVRKEDFRDVIAGFNKSVESLRASNQANFDRLLDKIDNINQDQSHR